MIRGMTGIAACLLLLLGLTSLSGRPRPTHVPGTEPGDSGWTANGRDAGGTRYSPLNGIDRGNVRELKVALTFRTGEAGPEWKTRNGTAFETTPLMVDGTLYLSTPLGRVFALDPVTGAARWSYDPKLDRDVGYGDFTNRGVSTWLDPAAPPDSPCRRTIYIATIDGRLIALDGRTGRPCDRFGIAGQVNLRDGLRIPPQNAAEYEMTSPPAVIDGLVVVGSAIADNARTDMPSGAVRAYDARTGAQRWAWDPIPQDSADAAWRTWEDGSARRTGAANAWSIITADPERDLVFVPTGSPSPDYYGGARLGDNRYANSVVALRASTGEVVWHFQAVHHDLWDYDVPAAPALLTVRLGGRAIPALLQATKMGHLFLLDRATGAPIFPVEERTVPHSDVAGERTSPTQPFPTVLPPLVPQRIRPEDAWGMTPWDRGRCRDRIRKLRNEGIFTPPSLRGSLVIPGHIGGSNWGGVAYDEGRGIVVVPTNRMAAEVQLIPRDSATPERLRELDGEVAMQRGTPYVMRREFLVSPLGLPCNPPPFGALTAIELATGRKLWEVPLGTTRDLFAQKIKLPIARPWGTPNLGGPIVTAGGLVFIGAAMDDYLRAFDIESGRELWKGRLPAGGQATPMTYLGRDGRQYVVIAAGGHARAGTKTGDSVVAFALPR